MIIKINHSLWKIGGIVSLMLFILLCSGSTMVAQTTEDPVMTFGVAGTNGEVTSSFPPVLDVVPANAAVSGYMWNVFPTDNPHNMIRSCLAYRERVEATASGAIFGENYTYGHDHLCYDPFTGQLAILKDGDACTTGEFCLETDGATAELRFKELIAQNPDAVWLIGSKPDRVLSGALIDAITVRDETGVERTELPGGATAYAQFYAYIYQLIEDGLQDASSTNDPRLAFCNTQIGGFEDDSFAGLEYCRDAYNQLQGALDARGLNVSAADSIHVLAASQMMFREAGYTKTVTVDGNAQTLTGGELLDEAVVSAAVDQHWSKYLRGFECWANIMSSCTESALQSIANPELAGIPLWLTLFGAGDGWCHEVHDTNSPLDGDGGTHCTEIGAGHPFVGRNRNEGLWGMMRHQVDYLVHSERWETAWWGISHSSEIEVDTTLCTNSGTLWHFEDSAGNRRCSDELLWNNPTEWTSVTTVLGTHYNRVIDCTLNDNQCGTVVDVTPPTPDPCVTVRSGVKRSSYWLTRPLYLPILTTKGQPLPNQSINQTPSALTPTVVATLMPTVAPTLESTIEPTAEPTFTPTIEPTVQPDIAYIEDYLPPVVQSGIRILPDTRSDRASAMTNAVFTIEFANGFILETTYEIFVTEDGVPTVLRDDGCGVDDVADDGIYSAQVELTPDEVALVGLGNDPITRGSHTISEFKELMYNGLDIVEDFGDTGQPGRTFDICGPGGTPIGNPDGVWAFKPLIMNIAGTTDEDVAADFVESWLRTWETPQTVPGNIDTTPIRSINNLMLNGWKGSDLTVPLDLDRAPFRLLAILPRLDLRETPTTTENGSAGEFRFVWGVLDPDNCSARPAFTVIFEYGIPADNLTEVKQWAVDIHSLGLLSGDAYMQRLEQLSTRITNLNADLSKPNGSAINQIRTNEIEMGSPWELREFVLDDTATLSNKPLVLTTVKQNPRDGLKSSTEIEQFITNNETALSWVDPLTGNAAPFHEVSESLIGIKATTLFAGEMWGSSVPFSLSDARHQFAVNTCNGCHRAETGTFFTMIDPRDNGFAADLAGFLTGTNVADPFDGTSREFDDLERRQDDLALMLNSTRYELGVFNGLVAREH